MLVLLCALAAPALAVARQAADPTAFATICRVDTARPTDPATPGSPLTGADSAHCILCLGTVSPPPATGSAPVVVAAVPEFALPVDRSLSALRDPAALQPQNPRAPPRG
ncbi:MAG: hypothetical protein EHM16_05825 [Betaproteobacteria bacterium]|nr:MAG: hypothetical protein EHM16_05825 [Betaproteobacteria bacterium]